MIVTNISLFFVGKAFWLLFFSVLMKKTEKTDSHLFFIVDF